jgi:hypothetical protein
VLGVNIHDQSLSWLGTDTEHIHLSINSDKFQLYAKLLSNICCCIFVDKQFIWKFYYRVAQNFPVDIYFLVDPSFTMRNLRTQLVNHQSINQSINIALTNSDG